MGVPSPWHHYFRRLKSLGTPGPSLYTLLHWLDLHRLCPGRERLHQPAGESDFTHTHTQFAWRDTNTDTGLSLSVCLLSCGGFLSVQVEQCVFPKMIDAPLTFHQIMILIILLLIIISICSFHTSVFHFPKDLTVCFCLFLLIIFFDSLSLLLYSFHSTLLMFCMCYILNPSITYEGFVLT